MILVFFLSYYFVSGQESAKKPDQIAFDEVLEVYYDEEYDSALNLFKSFLVDFPNSTLAPRSKYNIGYILVELGRDDESIPVFEELLESNYDDKETFGGLMEQYTLYKHRSASLLADIYLNTAEYEKASKYIRLFDKKYRYQHFGGNEMMAHEIYTAKSYARLYNGQGKPEKAISKLLPYIFDNGLASSLSLLDLLSGILEQKYSDEEMKEYVNKARASLIIKNEDTALIKLLGTKIEVFDYQLFALNNPEYKANLELKGVEKWHKVLNTNPIFERYIE
jgi:predicted Zn-dependent protease